jgi:predicted dehydrogenase
MTLTPEQEALGRRNFLKALAGTPALAALGTAAALKGPVRGGPVRLGYLCLGRQGRQLLSQTDPAYGRVVALCDINPSSLSKADEVLAKNGQPPAKHYVEWKEMLEKEDLEAVVMAPPLWMHADMAVGCLEAGKHVLCEKMMAWDFAGCDRMLAAARKSGRLLEIGYQRFYNPIYQAAYDGIIRREVLGDVYHSRLVWHRNQTWRRQEEPPAKDYDPSRWGYPTFDHLINWRLYWRYSQGLFAELASHQVNIANWFFGVAPEAVVASGGVYRFKEGGREVYDHCYATFDYPNGRTAFFSSIESNAFDDNYEMFMGTKGTLILKSENEALLFEEGAGRSTGIDVALKDAEAVVDTTETRPGRGPAPLKGDAGEKLDKKLPYRLEVSGFCSAVRTGKPLLCGPERAIHSAKACILANQAVEKRTRLAMKDGPKPVVPA